MILRFFQIYSLSILKFKHKTFDYVKVLRISLYILLLSFDVFGLFRMYNYINVRYIPFYPWVTCDSNTTCSLPICKPASIMQHPILWNAFWLDELYRLMPVQIMIRMFHAVNVFLYVLILRPVNSIWKQIYLLLP